MHKTMETGLSLKSPFRHCAPSHEDKMCTGLTTDVI